MPVRVFIIVALAAVAVTGCGRRGDLERPTASAVVEEPAVTSAPPSSGYSPLDPGSGVVAAPAEPEPAPPRKRRFLLDFLL